MAAVDFFRDDAQIEVDKNEGGKEENQTGAKVDKITMHTLFRKEEDAAMK
jgi:hypothetical protein